MNLDELAKKYGGGQVQTGASRFDDLAQKYGGSSLEADIPQPTPVKDAGFSLGDIAKSFGMGAAGSTKALTDVAGAGNFVSSKLEGATESLQKSLTPERQAEMERQAARMKAAEESGSILQEIKAGALNVAEAPLQSAAQALGSFVPYLPAMFAAPVAAAMRLTAGSQAAIRAVAQQAPKVIGTAQGAGAVKGSIYDGVLQAEIEAGVDPEVAKKKADAAQSYFGGNFDQIALGGGLGFVAGSSGVEKFLTPAGRAGAAQGMGRRVGEAVIKESLPEAAQGGQERLAQNIGLQREGYDVDAFKGVAGAATQEALTGALGAAPIAALSRPDPTIAAKKEEDKFKQEEEEFRKQFGKATPVDIKEPEAPTEFPGGYTATRRELSRQDVPESFGIFAEGSPNPLTTVQTQEEAQAKLQTLSEIRAEEQARLVSESDTISKGILGEQRKLEVMEATGQTDTDQYVQSKAALLQKEEEAAQKIKDLNDRIVSYSSPLSFAPVGTRTDVQSDYVVKRGDQEIGAFPTLQDAELKLREIEPEPFKQAEQEARVKTDDRVTQLKQTLTPMLEKFGLRDVGLNVVDRIENNAGGRYLDSLIDISLTEQNPVQTMRHEALHALKDLQFFTPQQYKVLEERANKQWIKEYLQDQTAEIEVDGRPVQMSRLDAYKRLGYSQEAIVEEAIADAFGAYARGATPPPGMIAALFKKLQNFFLNFGQALRGAGFESADDVFQRVERGELKSRKPKSEPKTKPEVEQEEADSEAREPKENKLFAEEKEKPKYSLAGEGVPMSTRPLMERQTAIAQQDLGLNTEAGRSGSNNVRDIAKALNQQTLEQLGAMNRNKLTQDESTRISEAIADEVAYQLQTTAKTGTGLGWYSNNYPNAVKRLARRFPELGTSQYARSVFSALVAVTSNGERVTKNIDNAIKLYSKLRSGKRLVAMGNRRPTALQNNLKVIQDLMEQHGPNFEKVLLKEITVSDMNAQLRKMGKKTDGSYLANTVVPAAAVYFGPKLGAFYANLSGSEGYLTMDLWWTRSINRMRGLLIPKATSASITKFRDMMESPGATRDEVIAATIPLRNKYEEYDWNSELEHLVKAKEPAKNAAKPAWFKKAEEAAGDAYEQLLFEHNLEKMANTIYKNEFEMLQEAPFTATDRKFMYDAARKAQTLLRNDGIDLSLADIQAALWYYEKRLYAKLSGRKADDIGYEEAIIAQANQGSGRARPSVVFDQRADRGDDASGKVSDSETVRGQPPGSEEKLNGKSDETTRPNQPAVRPSSRGGAKYNLRGKRGGQREDSRFTPLALAPSVKGFYGPDPRIVEVAEKYAEKNGINLKRQAEYVQVENNKDAEDRATRIAKAYEDMRHDPQNPEVKEAYQNLINQTISQYEALVDAGYKFWFIDLNNPDNLEYLSSPWNALRDMRSNKQMGIFPTNVGFGSNEDFDPSNNPLLQETEFEWPIGGLDGPKQKVLANDVFRAVHDAFGHGLEGAGFRATGEENAWQAHSRLFTGSAIKAITSETRGQNSAVNYGPNGEFNRKANPADTIYADQKVGLMPSWTWEEGLSADEPIFQELDSKKDAKRFLDAVERVKTGRPYAFPLHVHDLDTYKNAKLFLSEDEESGFALIDDEIGSFFSGGRGQAYPTLRLAVDEGGRRIDTYRTKLPGVMGKANFRPVARVKFNADLATPLWDKNKFKQFQGGEPDLVFYVYDPSFNTKGEKDAGDLAASKTPLVEYDEAIALQRKAVEDANLLLRGITLGEKQVDSISVYGSHYGKAQVSELDASKYGTGIRGAESRRLERTDDERIKRRVYFYIAKTDGSTPTPESGVGQYVYTQKFDNILGQGPEMGRLFREANGDSNNFESLIVDAGYDGYAIPEMGMMVILDHNVPVNYVGPRSKVGVPKLSLRTVSSPAFKQWFGDSKIVNADGTPKVMYHGLAKDTTDFTRKTERGAPIFLTDDPKFADRFATDSYLQVADHPEKYLTKAQLAEGEKRAISFIRKDYGKDTLGKEMIASIRDGSPTAEAREYLQKEYVTMLPTGPHIMPLYVRAERPFDYDNASHVSKVIRWMRENNGSEYIAIGRGSIVKLKDLSQVLKDGDWEAIEADDIQEAIKEAGFDSFYVKEHGRKNLAVYQPNQVKSATGNTGQYSRTDNDVRYSLKNVAFPSVEEAKKAVAKTSVPKTDEFKLFIAGNQWIDEDGDPKVFYHATAREFFEFDPDLRVVYLSDTPEAAEPFGKIAEDRLRQEIYRALNKQEKLDFFQRVVDDAVKADKMSEAEASTFMRKADRKIPEYGNFGDIESEVLEALIDLSPTRMSIMPLYARAETPFDFEDKEQVARVMSWVRQNVESKSEFADQKFNALQGSIVQGTPQAIEQEGVQRALRRLGFDGYTVRKRGQQKSYAVYTSEQVKSVTGNLGEYSRESKNIKYSLPTIPQKLQDRMGETTTRAQRKTVIQSIVDAIRPTSAADFRAKALNRYNQMSVNDKKLAEQRGGIALLADESAESAALMSDLGAGVAASAMGFDDRNGGIPVLRNGITTIDKSVKGLIASLAPLAQHGDPAIYQRYQYWAMVKRGQRLNSKGKLTGIDTADVAFAKILEQKHPEFIGVQKDLIAFNNGLVQYMVDTGVLSQERGNMYTKYADYIPFYRQMDGGETQGPNLFQSLSGVKPPKKYKGADVAEAPIADFLETMVRNTQSSIQAGIKNYAAQRAINVAVQVKAPGMGAERLNFKSDAPDVINVLEKGNLVSYRTPDTLLVNAMMSLNQSELPFMGFLSAPADLLRNLVTKEPGFMMANMLRDSLSAWVTSGVKMTPIAGTVINFGKAIARTSPGFEALLDAGIIGGYEFNENIEKSGFKLEDDLAKKAGKKDPIYLRPFTSVWDALGKGTTASDAATRALIYERVLAETGNEAEALYRALEVMNFHRKGSSPLIRVLTAAVPFFNARLQGLDVFYRASFGRMNNKDAAAIQRQFFMRGMSMMVLSGMYWMLVSDDEEYKKQEQETKDNNWIIPAIGAKIPIPFEVGVLFKVIPERIAAYLFGNDTGEDLKKSMIRSAVSTFAFNPIPQTVKPVLEAYVDYNMFTMRPILGQGMKDIEPEYQVGPSTSNFAIALAQNLGLSPIKVDHIIKGYTGTIGMYAIDTIDMVMDQFGDSPKPTKRFEQLPIIKRFAADPEARGYVTQYYELKDAVDTTVRTMNLLEKTNQPEEYIEYVLKNQGSLAFKDYISDTEKSMKELREMKIAIRSSSMDGDEKRDALLAISQMESALTSNIQEIKKTIASVQ